MKKICYICMMIVLFTLFFSVTAQAEISEKQTVLNAHSIRPNNMITGVHVGEDIEKIANNTFVNQIQLKYIEVADGNPNFSSFSYCLYDKEQTTLLCFPQAKMFAEIPSTAVAMDSRALHGVNEKIASKVKEVLKANAEKKGVEFQIIIGNTEEENQIEYWPYTCVYPLTDND